MAEMRTAFVDVPLITLVDMLYLPVGTVIHGLSRSPDGNLRLLVGHESLPAVPPGSEIPLARPVFEAQAEVIMTSWGL